MKTLTLRLSNRLFRRLTSMENPAAFAARALRQALPRPEPADELLQEALSLPGPVSVGLLQRRFSIGYSRAARLLQALAQGGYRTS